MKKIFTLTLLLFSFQSFSAIDLENGLVAYYSFDGDAKDKSGNGADLIITGAVPAKDRNGNDNSAYTFNGTSDVMSGTVDLKSSTSVTVGAWIKVNPSALKFFLTLGNATVALATEPGNGVMVISTPYTNSTRASITADEWTHLTGTYDGTDIKIYVNGVYATTKNWPPNAALQFGSYDLLLGNYGTEYWAGTLDEVTIYNRLLNEEEIAVLKDFNQPVTGIIDSGNTRAIGVYPVPAKNTLMIENNLLSNNSEIIILNSYGTVVAIRKFTQNSSIDVSQLTEGLYILQVISEEKKYSGKFIKE